MAYRSFLHTCTVVMVVLILALAGVMPAQAAPPSNDEITSAKIITEPLPFTDTMDTTEATYAPEDLWCSEAGPTVWYQFTPDRDMTVLADTSKSDYKATLGVYIRDGDGLGYVKCNYGSETLIPVTAGVTYYFMVGVNRDTSPGGTLVLTVNMIPPPSNDEITSATIVTGPLPFTDTIDTRGATTASDDPDCYGSRHTVWYQFTPRQSMELTIDTFGSDYDTTLALYTGTPGSLIQDLCKNDPIIPYLAQAAVYLDAIANETYYIMVGAFDSGGTLVFNIDLYHNVSVDIRIDPFLSFNKDGTVMIRGTINCPYPTEIDWMDGGIEQKAGLRMISGSFDRWWEELCWGERTWQVLATPENGRFRGGPATVHLRWLVFDIVTHWGTITEASADVRLRGKK